MARNRLLYRSAAALLAAAAAVFAVLVAATPAHADDVEVRMRGISSTFTIDGFPRAINVSLESNQDAPISARGRFIIHMNGLSGGSVRITRNGQSLQISGDGDVYANDPASIDLGADGQRTVFYSMQFLSGAPTGRLDVTYELRHNGEVIGSDNRDTDIRQGRFGPGGPGRRDTPTTTPPNTDPGVVRSAVVGPTYDLAPIDQAASDPGVGSDFPPLFYVMGAVLLAAGGALLWLLFRRQPATAGAGGSAATGQFPVVPPSPGGPTLPRRAMQHPTAVLPTVRDQHGMQPPVDPWARGAGPAHGDPRHSGPRHADPHHPDPRRGDPRPPLDRTREFGPFDGTP